MSLALIGVQRAVKETQLVGQSNSLNPVCLPNLVQAAKIMENIKQHTGLYSGDQGFACLEFPQSLCFRHKPIY